LSAGDVSAVIDRIDEPRAIDRVRHRLPEFLLAEPGTFHRIHEGLARRVRAGILIEHHQRRVEARSERIERVIALLLVALDQRDVLRPHLFVEVGLAGRESEQLRVEVRHDEHQKAVDVGKPLPLRVDLPVVRIALEDEALIHRELDEAIRPEADDILGLRVEAVRLHEASGFVDTLELVPREDRQRRDVLEEHRVVLLQNEPDRVVVDLFDPGHRSVALREGILRGRRNSRIEEGRVGEDDVVRGEGLAIGPAHATAKLECPREAVGRQRVRSGKAVDDLLRGVVVRGQRRVVQVVHELRRRRFGRKDWVE
jgi:hypothetical protein